MSLSYFVSELSRTWGEWSECGRNCRKAVVESSQVSGASRLSALGRFRVVSRVEAARVRHEVSEQGGKFDLPGEYGRRYEPQLAGLPIKHIHAPWTAPEPVLAKAGVDLGSTCPKPVADHAAARQRALDGYAAKQNIRSAYKY